MPIKIAIPGLDTLWKLGGCGAAGLFRMPNSRTGADPRDANPQRRRFVARFLAIALRIGFFFAFDFTAALAMSSPSLIALRSSNQVRTWKP